RLANFEQMRTRLADFPVVCDLWRMSPTWNSAFRRTRRCPAFHSQAIPKRSPSAGSCFVPSPVRKEGSVEPRKAKRGRFRIVKLEMRIAPTIGLMPSVQVTDSAIDSVEPANSDTLSSDASGAHG